MQSELAVERGPHGDGEPEEVRGDEGVGHIQLTEEREEPGNEDRGTGHLRGEWGGLAGWWVAEKKSRGKAFPLSADDSVSAASSPNIPLSPRDSGLSRRR